MSVHGNHALSGYSATTLPVPLSEINNVERNAAPLHLLIVDDDEHIREVCRTVAEECGMKGHDVSTAEEALEVMEAFWPIDVRIVAATNCDLDHAIKSGSFRQDLYFRLNVVQIKLPALRERKSDIPLLVTAFLEKFSNPDEPHREMTEDATRRLMAYDWPGNVRELENAIERAVALGSGPYVALHEPAGDTRFWRGFAARTEQSADRNSRQRGAASGGAATPQYRTATADCVAIGDYRHAGGRYARDGSPFERRLGNAVGAGFGRTGNASELTAISRRTSFRRLSNRW
jgi:DNA-binding NtrC family response regulator